VYYFTSRIFNSYYQYIEDFTFGVSVAPCRYLADSVTGKAVSTKTYYREPSSESVSLAFSVKRPQAAVACSSATNHTTFYAKKVEVWPDTYFSASDINFTSTTINTEFTMEISKSKLGMVPYEQIINVVATLSYADATGNLQDLSIAYRLLFAYTISPVLSSNFQNILIDKSLILNASETSVPEMLYEE